MPAAEIAASLDGRREGRGWRCCCPVHGGHSLVVRDGLDGRLLVKCWGAGCSIGDIFRELRRLQVLDGNAPSPETSEAIEKRRTEEVRDRHRRTSAALDLWSECHPPHTTLVATYWRSRGLSIPIPPIIRMHGMMHHRESDARRPAIVALVEHVEHGAVGVHVTYLAVDGSMQATVEPRKRSLGPVGGGAVRLAHVQHDRALVIAEGIETTASVMQATGLPGWAALSANGIRSLVLPQEACNLLIAVDNDANGAGAAAACKAAERWLAEGRLAKVAMPPVPGTDFNDVLLGRAHARIEVISDVAA